MTAAGVLAKTDKTTCVTQRELKPANTGYKSPLEGGV